MKSAYTFVALSIVVFAAVWANARPDPTLTATDLRREGEDLGGADGDQDGYRLDYDDDEEDDVPASALGGKDDKQEKGSKGEEEEEEKKKKKE